MSYRDAHVTKEPESEPPPTTCPFCRSPKIGTASERVDASTYWRCEACGDMWNIARLRHSSRYNGGPRWQRT